MRPVPRPLLVLHSDPHFREQIRRAAGKHFQCTLVNTWETLQEELRTAPPSALAVVDPYAGAGGDLANELRVLLLEFPSATVLTAMAVRASRYRDLRTLGAWGVAEVITLEEDDRPEAIGRRLREVQGRSLQAVLDRAIPPQTNGHARALLMAAADVVATGGQARELARALFLSPRTLLRWCERSELPPPRRLLVWMRLLLAAELLDDPGRTVSSVAVACGYSSDNSLRRALQDLLNTTPTELRRTGAFALASRAFLQELTAVREGTATAVVAVPG